MATETMKTDRRPCEGCKGKLPKDAHPNRRFCTRCRRKRHTSTGRRKRKGRRPDGAPTKCTPEAIKEFCEAYAMGLTQEHAAGCIGVSARAVSEWFARGRVALEDAGIDPGQPPDDVLKRVPERERPFVQIFLQSQRVRSQGTRSLFGVVHRSAHGGAHWERNPNYNPDDPDSPQFVQTGYNPPDPRSALRLLALRSKEYSERYRVAQEISGPDGGAIPIGVVITLPPEEPPPEEEGE